MDVLAGGGGVEAAWSDAHQPTAQFFDYLYTDVLVRNWDGDGVDGTLHDAEYVPAVQRAGRLEQEPLHRVPGRRSD
jgi:hypothetical protein